MNRTITSIMLVTMLLSGSGLLVSLVSNGHAGENSVISFLSNENGDYDIFVINTDGSVLQRHVTDTMRKSSLTCSTKGYLFSYQSNERGNPDIYRMDIRNRISFQLTQDAERNIRPAWSPNGEWIAFVSDRDGSLDIYRMDADGSNLMKLTNDHNNGRPAWSPDSQFIAFDSQKNGIHSINTMSADGQNLKQLTGDLPLGPGCAWSPNGKQIAYASGSFLGEGMDIFTIDVEEKETQKLTNMGRGFRSGNPAWSPDGNCIAYSVVEVDEWPTPLNGFNIEFGDSTIYIVKSKGGIAIPLEETTGLSSDHVPVWVSDRFFPVSPEASQHIVTWGNLKSLRVE